MTSVDGILEVGPLAAALGNHRVAARSQQYKAYAGEVLRTGMVVGMRHADRVTPLMLAIDHKRSDMVRDLVSNTGHVLGNASHYPYPPRANLEARDKFGKTAVHYAATTGAKPEHMELLLRAGADPDVRDTIRGETALHKTAKHARNHTRILLNYGARVDVRDDIGRTPLHVAVVHGTVHTVKDLLDAGADVRARDRWGRTPLHLAVLAGPLGIVKVLLTRGADPNARDDSGLTPLDNILALMRAEPMGTGLLHGPVDRNRRRRVVALLRRAGAVEGGAAGAAGG